MLETIMMMVKIDLRDVTDVGYVWHVNACCVS